MFSIFDDNSIQLHLVRFRLRCVMVDEKFSSFVELEKHFIDEKSKFCSPIVYYIFRNLDCYSIFNFEIDFHCVGYNARQSVYSDNSKSARASRGG